jgi:hypothetical protein
MEDQIFTLEDMRDAFEAGKSFQESFMIIELSLSYEGEEDIEEEPDFEEWIEQFKENK